MNTKVLKVHGLWALGLVAAFGLGTHWQTQQELSTQKIAQKKSAEFGPSGSRRTDSEQSGNRSASTRGGRSANESAALLSQVFDGATISADGMETLAKEALRDPNPIKRRLAFSKLLEGLTPENAAAIRDQLADLNANGTEWRDFNYAWGALAGADAFQNALTGEKRDLQSLISGWAAVDPSGAMAMLGNLPEELADQKASLENGIVAGLADRDRDEAANYVYQLATEGRKDTARLMETVADEVLRESGHEEAANWVKTLGDGPLKGSAMNQVAERFVRIDPEAASEWIEEFAGEDYAKSAKNGPKRSPSPLSLGSINSPKVKAKNLGLIPRLETGRTKIPRLLENISSTCRPHQNVTPPSPASQLDMPIKILKLRSLGRATSATLC
jgi:hypothetical protein